MRIDNKHAFLIWFFHTHGDLFAQALSRARREEGCTLYDLVMQIKPFRPRKNGCFFNQKSLKLHYFDNGDPHQKLSTKEWNLLYKNDYVCLLADGSIWRSFSTFISSTLKSPAHHTDGNVLHSWEHLKNNRRRLSLKENNSYIRLLGEVITTAPCIAEVYPYAVAYANGYLVPKSSNHIQTVERATKRLIGKFQDQMPDSMWPHYRERLRMASGINDPLPKHFPAWPSHYAFQSRANEGNIAYTASSVDLARDRQVSIRPGRYLSRYYPELNNEQVKKAITKLHADMNIAKLIIAESVDEVVNIYNFGPSSCMDGTHDWDHLPVKPSAVYFSPDVTVAAIVHPRSNGRFSARCVVNKKNKLFSRVYGDNVIAQMLKAKGYTYNDYALEGCRLRCIPKDDRNNYVMPYLDHVCRVSGPITDSDGEWFIVEDDGDWDAQHTSGYISLRETVYCESCGDRVYDDDMRETEFDGMICNCCIDNHYVYATNSRGQEVLVSMHDDELVRVDDDDSFFVDADAAVANGYVFLDAISEWVNGDDTIENRDGELMRLSEAFPLLSSNGTPVADYAEYVFLNPSRSNYVAGFYAKDPTKLAFFHVDDANPDLVVNGTFQPAVMALYGLMKTEADHDDKSVKNHRQVRTNDPAVYPFTSESSYLSLRPSAAARKILSRIVGGKDEAYDAYDLTFNLNQMLSHICKRYLIHCWQSIPMAVRENDPYWHDLVPTTTRSLYFVDQAVLYELHNAEAMQQAVKYCEELNNTNPTTEQQVA